MCVRVNKHMDGRLSFPAQQVRCHNGKLEGIQLPVLYGADPKKIQNKKD